MAKKGDCKMCGWVMVLLGVLFLLHDLGYAPWWTVEWWSVGFLLLGLKGLMKKD